MGTEGWKPNLLIKILFFFLGFTQLTYIILEFVYTRITKAQLTKRK